MIIYISFGVALIPFPFDYDQAEGFELNNAILLADGGCPYCDNNEYPFYASGYAPFFHVLMVPFIWVFGAGFWYGRLIIFLATLITALAIAYAVWREENHLWVAVIAGSAFLASNFIYHIGPLLRQHLLMVMFETLSVVIIANAFKFSEKGRNRRVLIAFLFLLLAGYTKQLAYSTCIAVGAWLFLRNPRLALKYSIGLSVIAGVIFAWAMLVTDGQWWINIISSNQNEYITQQFTSLLGLFIDLHFPILILALLFTAYELYFTRLSAYTVWFVVSLASTVGAGKWGAGDSYFATTLAATCILAGIFTARSLKHNWQLPENNYLSSLMKRIPINANLLATGSLILILIYGGLVVKLPTSGIYEPIAEFLNISPKPGHRYPLYDSAVWTVGYAVTGHFPSEQDYESGQYITDRVTATEGLVISEDAGFVIQANREVVTNAVQLRNLWENGLYDPENLLELIENHDIGLIIRRADLFPVPILLAIDEYYELDESVAMNGFNYELWIPKINANTSE
ncbi:MAG: hypothetical protein Phog2KO_16070 [Phototrophicaceae bacterium]